MKRFSPPSPPHSPCPFLTISDNDVIMSSPPRVAAATRLLPLMRDPPVLRPRRLDHLSLRARLVNDEFANTTRLPKTLLKKRKRRSASALQDPTFEKAVRCLAGEFLKVKDDTRPVKIKTDGNISDDDIVLVSETPAVPHDDEIFADRGLQS